MTKYMKVNLLIPEFGKIICASFSFITPKGDIHTQTFKSDDEVELLLKVKDLVLIKFIN